jgi:hypothetical protein
VNSSLPENSVGNFGLGLFLTLAFVMPAVIYLGFIYIFFPNQLIAVIKSASAWAPASDILAVLAGFGALSFIGIVLTSITFTFEFAFVRKLPKVKGFFPPIGYTSIAKLQVKGKQVGFILQISGQAVMHFNIWSGVLLITILYVVSSFTGTGRLNLLKLLFASSVIVVNLYTSCIFFRWASEAINDALG